MAQGRIQKQLNRLRDRDEGASGGAPPEGAPLGGTRAEAMQRLQVGIFGIGSMILLIGLASVIGNQADLTEEGAVPEAAPTTEPSEAPAQRDPLADAGIVPDIPAEPSPTPSPTPGNTLDLDGAQPGEGAPPAPGGSAGPNAPEPQD